MGIVRLSSLVPEAASSAVAAAPPASASGSSKNRAQAAEAKTKQAPLPARDTLPRLGEGIDEPMIEAAGSPNASARMPAQAGSL